MGLPLPQPLTRRGLSMGHYLHLRNRILLYLCTLFISSVLGQVNQLPASQLTTVSAIHPVDVDVSVVLHPVPQVTFNRTSLTSLRSILGDISGVDVRDIDISAVEKKGPCSSEQKDGGLGRRKLQQEWASAVAVAGQSSRNLLIESEGLIDRGVDTMCWHKVALEDAGVKSLREPAELNVTLTIRTEDRSTVADRILVAKQTGALEERLSEAGLKDNDGTLSVVVESDSASSTQDGSTDGSQQVQASILISRTSVSDLTTKRIEALKSFLANFTGVSLDAIIIVDVRREIAQGIQMPQGKQMIDQSPVDLNVTFALYTAQPGYVSAVLWDAAKKGFVNEIIDGAELQVLSSMSDISQDIPQNPTSGQIIGTAAEHYQSQNAISWWQLLLLIVGVLTILVMPCCAVYLNKFRVRNYTTPEAPIPIEAMGEEEPQSPVKPHSLELREVSPQAKGKIQSFLPVLGDTTENVLPLPYGGRHAMQLDAFVDRYEGKPQWRTTQKTAPSIRDISTDSESGGIVSDSFSDYYLDITPTGSQQQRSDTNSVEATQDLFFTITDPNLQTPASDGDSKRCLDDVRSSAEDARRTKRSDVSASDYLSADDGEEVTQLPVCAPSTVVRTVELAMSFDLPPSPYSISARARDSPTTSVRKVPRLFTSPLDSSDLEYDVRSPDVRGNSVSPYQYRAYDQEPDCEAYNRQYVNYLFDGPPSTSRTNTSDNTSPGAQSGNNGYRMRNLNSRW